MSAEYQRRVWAQTYLDRADGPVVAYGSPEWAAMSDGPQKVAACVAAAERCVYLEQVEEQQVEAQTAWLVHLHQLAEQGDWEARQEYRRRSWTVAGGFEQDSAIRAEVEAEWDAWVRGGAA